MTAPGRGLPRPLIPEDAMTNLPSRLPPRAGLGFKPQHFAAIL